MSEHALLQAAASRVVIADGAMGTELTRAGLPAGAPGDLWNVERPDIVRHIHRRYRDAGAEILLTNTFGSNRLILERHELGHRAPELARAGATLARRAAGAHAWVLGDVGPFGGFLEPVGDTAIAQASAAFWEQVTALLQGGVDGIMIETMGALDELLLATRCARDAGATLVVGSLSFEATKAGIRTMTGLTPDDGARAMRDAGVDILGANCGTGLTPEHYAEIAHRYKVAVPELPVLVKANAGQPHLRDDALAYDETPEHLASAVRLLLDAGASIVGGCCGTTPDHIRALAGTIRSSEVGAH